MKPRAVCDTECYRDYWLISFKNIDTGNVRSLELYEGHPLDVDQLKKILASYTVITFNGRNYDMPMIALALTGVDNATLKAASDTIIEQDMKPWEFERAYDVTLPACDHIDLIEVAPGQASLKLYGGRMHSRRLQDMPISPDELVGERRPAVRGYCENDLQTTIDLANYLAPQIKLREQMSVEYGIDLRSKSDAQIAEAVIRKQVQDRIGRIERPIVRPGTTFKYKAPHWLRFDAPELKRTLAMVCDANFGIAKNGSVEMPAELDGHSVKIGQSVYRMGIGGIHSSEQNAAHHAGEEHILVDRDVASYYPSIILQCGLEPDHLKGAFLEVYRGIVKRRLDAKHSGDKVTADALKITINGSFGKLGSMWSSLYAPNLMIQVTLTGQLALLMLIERLEARNIHVVSGNTDGIVIRCHKMKVEWMHSIVRDWERNTGFDTEETAYASLYSRDVNNYIAVKPDGKTKTKGAYAFAGLQKNPASTIVIESVLAQLTKGTSVEATIRACTDIRKFVTVRRVAGGGQWAGMYLGKTVRWYYSRDVAQSVQIRYVSNGNKVSRSEGCMPCMVLPDALPRDIDYDWYVREAHSILKEIGHV
jgi:hypothetical protein